MIITIRAAMLAALLGLPAAFGPALAHVTLDTPQATAKTYVRIAIRVPHGCDGIATTGLRVQIPEGVTAVKPMPKPGWDLTIVRGEGPSAAGHDAGPAIHEVIWRGGPLPDAFFEEFVVRILTPDTPGQTIWFPFVQECEGGKVTRWIEKPADGQAIDQLRLPAFPMRVMPRP